VNGGVALTDLALGIDFGTSGARAIALDPSNQIVAESRHVFTPSQVDNPIAWRSVLYQLIKAIPQRSRLHRIAINGTSATVLLCDAKQNPLTPALLYNDTRARSALTLVEQTAPAGSATLSATSSLTKALWWFETLDPAVKSQVSQLAHQADWLAAQLHGQAAKSDYHNALKLGYDVHKCAYPNWLLALPIASWLPRVWEPGSAISPISSTMAADLSLPKTCQICAGTTDSIAAFLASGATQPGEGVTSLGSTLVLKLLSRRSIDDSTFGVYSHKLGDLWLAGGASNTGGAVLKQFFSSEQIAALSAQIDPTAPCSLRYYPLNRPGERFPINDPDYLPQLAPRPAEDKAFLHGLLDSIARIEAEGYQKLHELGGPAVTRVYTAGGGAQNELWRSLRQQKIGKPVTAAAQTEAAYGTAQLAMNGLTAFKQNKTLTKTVLD